MKIYTSLTFIVALLFISSPVLHCMESTQEHNERIQREQSTPNTQQAPDRQTSTPSQTNTTNQQAPPSQQTNKWSTTKKIVIGTVTIGALVGLGAYGLPFLYAKFTAAATATAVGTGTTATGTAAGIGTATGVAGTGSATIAGGAAAGGAGRGLNYIYGKIFDTDENEESKYNRARESLRTTQSRSHSGTTSHSQTTNSSYNASDVSGSTQPHDIPSFSSSTDYSPYAQATFSTTNGTTPPCATQTNGSTNMNGAANTHVQAPKPQENTSENSKLKEITVNTACGIGKMVGGYYAYRYLKNRGNAVNDAYIPPAEPTEASSTTTESVPDASSTPSQTTSQPSQHQSAASQPSFSTSSHNNTHNEAQEETKNDAPAEQQSARIRISKKYKKIKVNINKTPRR